MSGSATTFVAFLGLCVLVGALVSANGRRVVVVISGGGLVLLMLGALLVGHAG